MSLSGALDGDGEGEGLSILDTIADETDMLEDIARQESIALVRKTVNETLTGREAEVIRLRYGLSGQPPMPQREVAEHIGISRSYVSRIEKKALERLRKRMEDAGGEKIV